LVFYLQRVLFDIVILFIKCVLHTTVLVFKWSNLIGSCNDLILIIFYDIHNLKEGSEK